MDITYEPDRNDSRIDSRILRHVLQEASDLLEEAQTHTLIEKQGDGIASVLSQANWRMTATCIWAIGELLPGAQDQEKAAQLHAPIPVFSRGDETLSPQLQGFVQRVNRLHERARRLDDLSRGPMVSTEDESHAAAASRATEPHESAQVIPLFGRSDIADEAANPIAQVRSRMRRAMGGVE